MSLSKFKQLERFGNRFADYDLSQISVAFEMGFSHSVS